MATSLTDAAGIVQQPLESPLFDLARNQLEQSDSRLGSALTRSLEQQQLEQRTLPDIGNQFAAQNAFFGGTRIKQQRRAKEDTLQRQAQAEQEANKRIRDLILSAGLLPFGKRL